MIREILIGRWLDYRTEQLKNVDIYYCSKIPSHVDDGILILYLFERKKYFPTQSKVCSTLQCNKLLQYFISHLIELKGYKTSHNVLILLLAELSAFPAQFEKTHTRTGVSKRNPYRVLIGEPGVFASLSLCKTPYLLLYLSLSHSYLWKLSYYLKSIF